MTVLGVQRIGRYEVLNHLASGGMGHVYLARATGLGGFERQVVVKTLDLSITDDDEAFVTMFLDEARLVGALHHQYIAPVYEVGCDDEGRYYLVMDYVHGETAEAVFRVTGERALAMPLACSLTVVSCVASALHYAHGLCAADGTPLDIVHRDVSLSNVMIGHDGAVKLIDFGIAKAANRATKTQAGTLKGKIGYLAPEQILHRRVDHRADIFALGIVLYELTTATRAFREMSDLITLERITQGEITRPTKLIADYPPELERIVMKALQVDPDARYQDCGEMGHELEALAARMHMALGHAPVTDVMMQLFGERRGRRRFARSSNEVKTDRSNPALPLPDDDDDLTRADDELTPVHDMQHDEETDPRTMPLEVQSELQRRAQRSTDSPTIPIEVQRDSQARAQRPTLPITGSHSLPPEDRPTRMVQALVPVADRPPPIADRSVFDPPTYRESRPLALGTAESSPLDAPARPTPARPPPLSDRKTAPLAALRNTPHSIEGQNGTDRRSGRIPTGPQALARNSTPQTGPNQPLDASQPAIARVPTGPQPLVARVPTGPQLPLSAPTDLSDAPTQISATMPVREDPTDVSSLAISIPPTPRPRTATAEIVKPKWGPGHVATAVVSRMKPRRGKRVDPQTQTWLLLCALFGIAVLTAILIAVL